MLPQYHRMHLQIRHRSGAEEWYCPACGRRVLVDLQPDGAEVVLDPGDECSVHTGGDGDLGVKPAWPAGEDEIAEIDDGPGLAMWAAWLEEVDFGDG